MKINTTALTLRLVMTEIKAVIALCDRAAAVTDEDSRHGRKARRIAQELRAGLAEAAEVEAEHEAWLAISGLTELDAELDEEIE